MGLLCRTLDAILSDFPLISVVSHLKKYSSCDFERCSFTSLIPRAGKNHQSLQCLASYSNKRSLVRNLNVLFTLESQRWKWLWQSYITKRDRHDHCFVWGLMGPTSNITWVHEFISWSMCFMHRSSWHKNVFAKRKIEAGKIDCTNV